MPPTAIRVVDDDALATLGEAVRYGDVSEVTAAAPSTMTSSGASVPVMHGSDVFRSHQTITVQQHRQVVLEDHFSVATVNAIVRQLTQARQGRAPRRSSSTARRSSSGARRSTSSSSSSDDGEPAPAAAGVPSDLVLLAHVALLGWSA